MNGGTDAKNEMETWGNPDTNRTAITLIGGLAQLIEHFACTEGVNGLNPLSSTIVMIQK